MEKQPQVWTSLFVTALLGVISVSQVVRAYGVTQARYDFVMLLILLAAPALWWKRLKGQDLLMVSVPFYLAVQIALRLR